MFGCGWADFANLFDRRFDGFLRCGLNTIVGLVVE
jgi:hypothetical protein